MSLEFIDHPPPRAGWIHEVKHDGYRTLLIIERHKARAYTRNGFDWSESYPGITKSAAKLDCRSAIIDGEVIVQDERGVSDFESLKSAVRWRPQKLIFCAFDLLHLNGKDLRDQPLQARRATLKELVPTEHPFMLVKSSSETPPLSSKRVRITSLRASSPSSLHQDTEAAAARRASRQNASPKALS